MSSFISRNNRFLQLFLPAARPESGLDKDVAAAQQRVYMSNSLTMLGVNFVNAFVVSCVLSIYFDWRIAVLWSFSVSFFSIFGYIQFWKAKQRSRATGQKSSGGGGATFLKKAEWSAVFLGALWGLPNLIAIGHTDTIKVFNALVSAGMASGFVSMTNQLPRVATRFLIACATPILASCVIEIDTVSTATFVLAVMFVVALTKGSLHAFRQLYHLVESQAEAQRARADLYEAIEAIDDAFALRDGEGRYLVRNNRFREWFPDGLDAADAVDGRVTLMGDGRWLRCSRVPVAGGREVSVHTDVTALKERERELIAARREAEEASAAKGRFLATMSHELRTPLNIINGFSRLMTEDSRIPLTERDIRDYAGSIHSAGDHLLKVVNDIIEFSKIGAENYLLDPTIEDPRELITSAVSLSAQFQQIESEDGFEVMVSPGIGSIIVDAFAFRRILINLVTNAIKYGGEPTHVVIRAYLDADGAPVFTVRDFGRGLSERECKQAFDAFYQADRDRGGEFSGTGLGLTLSREMARLHDGDVTLTSRPGAGTLAMVRLPAEAHVARDDTSEDAVLTRKTDAA